MAKTPISDEKYQELKALLVVYRKEIEALFGLAQVWKQLSNKVKDICTRDFDEAIVARERLLEELNVCKNLELKTMLNEVDALLLEQAKAALDLYGFEAKSYLNEMRKKLPSP